MKESAIQRTIIDYLERMGFIVIRTNAGRIYHKGHMIRLAAKGTSDLVACSPEGRFWALEVKADAPITQDQLDFLEKVRSKGGVAEIVRGVKDVRTVIKES